jgi:hypothetical protein
MSVHLIAVVTVIYALISLDKVIQGHYPKALMWGAYAVANAALIWLEYWDANLSNK